MLNNLRVLEFSTPLVRINGHRCHIAIAPEDAPSLSEDLCVLSFQVLSRPRLPHTIAEAAVGFP